jgi:hypothetical protein
MTHRHRIAVLLATLGCISTFTVACGGSDSSSTPPDPDSGSSTPDGEASSTLEPGSEHDLVDEDGRFAYAAPRLAKRVELHREDDGGARVEFDVAYDVANTRSSDGVAADRAELRLWVARSMMSMGPRPDDLVFSTTTEDERLDSASTRRSYTIDLPAEAVEVLDEQGLSSDDAERRSSALQLVNVGVQQHRDLQVVDGELDWIHGSTFTAAQSPTAPADKPGGALTVRNDTATGVYTYPSASLEPVPQVYGPNLYPNPDEWSVADATSTGVPIALSGQSGSCFYQGTDGSNPIGFNKTLQPGVAITETIVANDMTDNRPFNNTEAAAIANATEDTLKTAVATTNAALSLAFGGPFTLIVALATNLVDVSEYCNNQPNLMQLGAVVANTGQGSNSTMWAAWDADDGTAGGFANVYSSPWSSSAPDEDALIATNAVQLAPDATYTYQGQPLWLAQTPIAGCGIGDAGNSNTSGCTSQNLISLRWSEVMPCPYNNGMQPPDGNPVGDSSWCHQPAPTSPEVSACGTNNAQCLSYDPQG